MHEYQEFWPTPPVDPKTAAEKVAKDAAYWKERADNCEFLTEFERFNPKELSEEQKRRDGRLHYYWERLLRTLRDAFDIAFRDMADRKEIVPTLLNKMPALRHLDRGVLDRIHQIEWDRFVKIIKETHGTIWERDPKHNRLTPPDRPYPYPSYPAYIGWTPESTINSPPKAKKAKGDWSSC